MSSYALLYAVIRLLCFLSLAFKIEGPHKRPKKKGIIFARAYDQMYIYRDNEWTQQRKNYLALENCAHNVQQSMVKSWDVWLYWIIIRAFRYDLWGPDTWTIKPYEMYVCTYMLYKFACAGIMFLRASETAKTG